MADPSSVNLYQFQEIDILKNTTTTGFVELTKKISAEEFVSFTDSNIGSLIIISNIGDEKFECSGTCFCQNIRKTSSVVTRSLFLSISAFSSSIALKIAHKTFEVECRQHFQTTCDEPDIFSSVNECRDLELDSQNQNEEIAEYSCQGHCYPKKLRSSSTLLAQRNYIEDVGGCERLQTAGTIKIKRDERIYITVDYEARKKGRNSKKYLARYKHMYVKARDEFAKVFLIPYCKEVSRISYLYESPRGEHRRKQASMCVGDKRDTISSKKNIKCLLTSESKLIDFNKRNLKT